MMGTDPSIAGMLPQELLEFVNEVEQRIRNQFKTTPYDPTWGYTPQEIERYLAAYAAINRPYNSLRSYTLDNIFQSAFPITAWRDVVFRLLERCGIIEEGRFYSGRDSIYSIAQPDGSRKEIQRYDPKFEIIEDACHRHPDVFADLLDKLFSVGISFYDPTNQIMWEQHGARHREFLKEYLYSTPLFWEQERTLIRLLWINTPETLRDAEEFFASMPDNLDKERISVGIKEGGYVYEEGRLQPLYPPKPYHLIFPKGYLTESNLDDKPSFQAIAPLPYSFAFGGEIEGRTSAGRDIMLDHIITFDPIPDNLPVTGLERLVIALSLSAVHYEGTEMYYRHTRQGLVIVDEKALEEREGEEVLPLKPTTVRLSDQGETYRIQDWDNGNLYRVGGAPNFIQESAYPTCEECGRFMPQILQLDSSLPMIDGNEHWWGSGGMAHIHWCDGCKISSIMWECS